MFATVKENITKIYTKKYQDMIIKGYRLECMEKINFDEENTAKQYG